MSRQAIAIEQISRIIYIMLKYDSKRNNMFDNESNGSYIFTYFILLAYVMYYQKVIFREQGVIIRCLIDNFNFLIPSS